MNKKIPALILAISIIFSVFSISAFAASYKKGDVNGDSEVGVADARLALRASASLENLTDEQKKAADVAEPFDRITPADARKILRVAIKLDVFEEDPVEEDYPAIIDDFFSGFFYMTAEMEIDGEKVPVNMAYNGTDFEIVSNIDGFDLSLFTIRNKINYLKFHDVAGKKYYVEFDSEAAKYLGMDLSKVTATFKLFSEGKPTFIGADEKAGYEYDVSYKVYRFEKADGIVLKFYENDGNIMKIAAVDAEGNIISNLVAAEGAKSLISTDLPDDILTIQGYERTSFPMLLIALKEATGN